MAAASSGLERLTLRLERLNLTFRFTYAFHAREVRFECDAGAGFERVFPETRFPAPTVVPPIVVEVESWS